LTGLTHLLTHTWDCQWTFVDGEAVAGFLALLAPHLAGEGPAD
jgi:hypothetical protein